MCGEWLLICLHIEKVRNGNGTEVDAQGDRRARHGADDGDLLLDCIKQPGWSSEDDRGSCGQMILPTSILCNQRGGERRLPSGLA